MGCIDPCSASFSFSQREKFFHASEFDRQFHSSIPELAQRFRFLFSFWENLKQNFKDLLILSCQRCSSRGILSASCSQVRSLANLKVLRDGPQGLHHSV